MISIVSELALSYYLEDQIEFLVWAKVIEDVSHIAKSRCCSLPVALIHEVGFGQKPTTNL